MNSTRVAIVDDEPLARMRLRRLLSSIPNIEIVAECKSGDQLNEELRYRQVDVVFLDIQMHNKDGFSAYAGLQEPRPHVIFVTAHSLHAAKAFEIDAIDYLVKPISLSRVRISVERARKRVLSDDHEINIKPASQPRRIALPIDRKLKLVQLDDLDCAFANANYLELRFKTQTLVLRKPISWLEAELDPNRFIRIHRSCLIRIDAVAEVEFLKSGRCKLTLENGLSVFSGRNYRDTLKNTLGLIIAKSKGVATND